MISYWPAIFISLLVHALVIVLVIIGWEQSPTETPFKPPSYIKATLVDLKTQGKQGAQVQKPKPKKIDLQKKRQEQERLKKQAAEKKRKNQIAKEKAEKAKRLKEKKLAEQRKKQQEELTRQAQAEQKELERQRFEENLTQERERIEAEQQAEVLAQQVEDDQILAQSYSDLIRKRITQNWSRPSSARNGMEALLRIQMIPTGEIIDVAIVKGSGNTAYDRSAIQAVKKTRQIPEIKDMPSRVFEKDFRQFQLIFKPQDLRQ
ncbi:MAG: cell envelope integrity protein TolA [Cellvibrionaceae bacterium]